MVSVPPFNPKHTANLLGNERDIASQAANEKDLERTTLLMFEIGTGKACAEMKSVFEISTFGFSADGKYLSLGSNTGSVCIWSLGEHLYQNIKQVLDSVKI
jgi:WD40 repeat protein